MEGPGDLLQMYGAVLSRILRRQFPSLAADVIDDHVVEAIARVWSRTKSSGDRAVDENAYFPLILTAARRRLIDQLRYTPRVSFTSSEILEQLAVADEPSEKADEADARNVLLRDLLVVVRGLDSFDRRILRAAMMPATSGSWARDLALELLSEEQLPQLHHDEPQRFDTRVVSRLSGKLRVRKQRLVEKLRQAMRDKGYDVPTFRSEQ